MSEPGEITFTFKFTAEEMDILDTTAAIMRKSRDQMLAEVFGPPTREFMGCVVNDLRKALAVKVHNGKKNGRA